MTTFPGIPFVPGGGLAGLVAQRGLVVSLAIGLVFGVWSGEWVILPATVMMWAFWRWMPTDCGPPGLPFAFSYHLLQLVAGVYYVGWTGRLLLPMTARSHGLMMWIGLGSVVAMAIGFLAGDRWVARRRPPVQHTHLRVGTGHLLGAYVVGFVVNRYLFSIAFDYPAIAQGILALSTLQLGLLYLLLRRLFLDDRAYLAILILGIEVARGFTGFYSDFKEPVIVGIVAMAEVFRPKHTGHWLMIGGLVGATLLASLIWMGIRGNVREDMTSNDERTRSERLQFALEETKAWWRLEPEFKEDNVDILVERVWDIYYTALALDRVPAVLPHEGGALLWAAIQHVVTPRFLNPDKPDLPSESESVRKYSGENVAGREQGTTIAFGYVIQSYVDFGIPLMFLPPLVWGLLLGLTYRFFVTTIRHEEILLTVVAAAFWMVIMLYNVAWAKWLGKFITGAVYIGVVAIVVDHFLASREQRLAGLGQTHPARVS